MAGSAGFGLFHVCHGVFSFILKIEYGVMTDTAVVIVFFKV